MSAQFLKKVGFQSGIGFGFSGKYAEQTEVHVFPIEATKFFWQDNADPIFPGALGFRLAAEFRLGHSPMGQMLGVRGGVISSLFGVEGFAGVNHRGQAIVGAQAVMADLSRLVVPGFAFGYEKTLGPDGPSAVFLNARWAVPFPSWSGFVDRLNLKGRMVYQDNPLGL